MVLVPAVAGIIAALLVVMLLLALQQFAKALSQVVPNWHIPGFDSLGDWIYGHAVDAYQRIKNLLDGAVAPFLRFVGMPIYVLRHLFDSVLGTLNTIYNAIHRITAAYLPQIRGYAAHLYNLAVAYATNWANHIYNLAVAFAQRIVNALRAEVHALFAQAINWANHIYNLAVAFAQGIVNALRAEVHALFGQAINWANHVYNLAVALATRLVAAAVADLTRLITAARVEAYKLFIDAKDFATKVANLAASTAIAALNGAMVTDIAHVWPQIQVAIDDVVDVAADGFSDVVTDLKGIAREIPRDIPAALAATSAIALAGLRLAKDCTMPNCRNLSGFGNELQALLAIIGDGALIALIAEAAHDPEGTGRMVHELFGGFVHDTVDGFERLVGV
jgi:hypothetical protein